MLVYIIMHIRNLSHTKHSHFVDVSMKAEYSDFLGTITVLKSENPWYPACPGEVDGRSCNKKLLEGVRRHGKDEEADFSDTICQLFQGDGRWRCEKCNRDYDQPFMRYVLCRSQTSNAKMSLLYFQIHS